MGEDPRRSRAHHEKSRRIPSTTTFRVRAIECGVLEDSPVRAPCGHLTLTADAQSCSRSAGIPRDRIRIRACPALLNGEEMGLR